jgi:hypothetical protein
MTITVAEGEEVDDGAAVADVATCGVALEVACSLGTVVGRFVVAEIAAQVPKPRATTRRIPDSGKLRFQVSFIGGHRSLRH